MFCDPPLTFIVLDLIDIKEYINIYWMYNMLFIMDILLNKSRETCISISFKTELACLKICRQCDMCDDNILSLSAV